MPALHKTRGIVLHKTKYAENSLVVKIYTEVFGLQSYLVQGTRSKSSSTKATLFQPLALLDLIVYQTDKGGLQRIKEIHPDYTYEKIPYDFSLSAVTLFMAEILYKTLKEEGPHQELFGFLHKILTSIDSADPLAPCTHHYVLLQLSKYLGFGPQGEYLGKEYCFDLREGFFRKDIPLHKDFLHPHLASVMSSLLGMKFVALAQVEISKQLRNELLNGMISYYRIHSTGLGEIKSHTVLESVMA